MRQTFDDTTDPSFGPRHVPLIRAEMARQGLDGFLIPHEDEHQNEYLPEANDRLAWATGFTGSAGAAAVIPTTRPPSSSTAATPCRCATRSTPACSRSATWSTAASRAWLEQTARPGQTIGYDPRLHSPDALRPAARPPPPRPAPS